MSFKGSFFQKSTSFCLILRKPCAVKIIPLENRPSFEKLARPQVLKRFLKSTFPFYFFCEISSVADVINVFYAKIIFAHKVVSNSVLLAPKA